MTVTQTTTRPPRGQASTAAATPAVKGNSHRQFDLNLPFVRIQVRPPELHLPHVGLPHVSRHDVGQAMDIARTLLPPPERLLYYGGLGALAVLGLIDWPVAAAIGAGTMIAQRTRAREQRWSPLRAPQPEAAKPPTTRQRAVTPAGKQPARRTTTRKATTSTPARARTTGRSRTTSK